MSKGKGTRSKLGRVRSIYKSKRNRGEGKSEGERSMEEGGRL
jgi:hypothetical protein